MVIINEASIAKKDHLHWYSYFINDPSLSVKSKRNFLIKEYYDLVDIKAYRAPKDSMLYKAWLTFEKKWNERSSSI